MLSHSPTACRSMPRDMALVVSTVSMDQPELASPWGLLSLLVMKSNFAPVRAVCLGGQDAVPSRGRILDVAFGREDWRR